ncbi:ROK family transcriptional regulator [Clostridium thailandense]|uniref:ROK family transcriptional regulator n=1 Tax=Clostridium thailandense TaxID=2794346 RepID=A0A949TLD3_9CLOT|nr:ROK family transcriptional regulator [Clostridium thailandense]MBV7272597.1 ROK family transcriptional regulator [Clostridium thailandense]
MLRKSKLTQEQISEINKVKIIRLIKEKEEITKLELGTKLGLSHTTINTYIQTLIDEGLVQIAGVAASSGGRKPIIVKLIPEAKYSFGVSITPTKAYIVLVNLAYKETTRDCFSYGRDEKMENILRILKEHVEKIIKDNLLDRKKILGIGIVFPGTVDDDKILIESAPNLKVKNYSLKGFQEEIGMKIYAEKEANAAAYAEQLVGNAKDEGNFVYVSIAEGIGAGVIIENYIYKGRKKKAGEFGHMKVSDEKIKCNCGRYGCWERFASKNALLNYFEQYKNQKGYSLEELFYAYNHGDIDAIQAVEKYARYLFVGIENILLSVNPDCIVIGGDLGGYAEEIIKVAVDKLKLTENFFGYENIKIYCSGLKENGAIIGAALLPLEEIFNYQKNVI